MMPVSIIHTTSVDNKGSCSKYGHYLNKENEVLKKEGQGHRQQFFFDQEQNRLTTIRAIDRVDRNSRNKGLAKKQDRYFTMTLNFSKKEMDHLTATLAKRPIRDIDELKDRELQDFNEVIRLFTRQAMCNYADNFNKGVTEKQLVWFAKIEHRRYYKGTDREVMVGKAKSGERKEGLQTHVHITVSRMHKEFRINLSPLAHARNGKNLVLNGKKVNGGFDRSQWKQLNEDTFDEMFKYNRGLEEKFETLRVLKHGTLEEKKVLKMAIQQEKDQALENRSKSNKMKRPKNIQKERIKSRNNQITR
ncbi:DUF5712 family protein [Maribacter sp. 4G9]|uniref:DUF5712 family protein n=1 Tax=Maribacter sp. 4G9 TaxID=1889777 RepID=UPI000C15D4E9|nr:DUF5712 family protein [Maribacter sp. 4G9]PIB30609.1 hypothetical protein BFP75_02430 [Maribacter sp. 4G9]